MKRREFERHLRGHGCFLHHAGGSHDIWVNPGNGAQAPVPRHGTPQAGNGARNLPATRDPAAVLNECRCGSWRRRRKRARADGRWTQAYDGQPPSYNPYVIATARLRLRRWRDDDLEPFAALNADPRVREFFPSVQTYQESAESMEYIGDHWQRHGFGLWAVELIGGAPFIGFIGLSVPSFDAPFMPCVELGYRLAFEYWGQGYATEGSRAALAFGFATIGLPEIVALTAADNARSRRVMERLGLRRNPAEDFDHPNIVAGHPLRRHVLYRLSAGEWTAGQS